MTYEHSDRRSRFAVDGAAVTPEQQRITEEVKRTGEPQLFLTLQLLGMMPYGLRCS